VVPKIGAIIWFKSIARLKKIADANNPPAAQNVETVKRVKAVLSVLLRMHWASSKPPNTKAIKPPAVMTAWGSNALIMILNRFTNELWLAGLVTEAGNRQAARLIDCS
jgi:hypothetical protein